jgi:hypothetical protein
LKICLGKIEDLRGVAARGREIGRVVASGRGVDMQADRVRERMAI